MVLGGWGRGGVLEGGIESEGAGWFSILVHRKQQTDTDKRPTTAKQ